MMKRSAAWVMIGVMWSGCTGQSNTSIPVFDTADAEPQVAERLQSLRDVVVAHPDSAAAWGLLALSLQAHDFPEAAVQAYAAARSRRRGIFAYAYLPAIILADRGDPAASELFESARSLRTDYVPLRLREAAWQLELGKTASAIELVDDSLVMVAAPARASLILARASLAQDDLSRAREILDAGIVASPRYGELHALSAQLYRRQDESEQAALEEMRAQTFRGEPGIEDPVLAALYNEGISSRWHILKGQGHLAAGRPRDARLEFDEAVSARPSDAHGWNQLGIALQALGEFEEAEESHRRALELRPAFADASANLAMSLFRSGRTANALDAARQAIESDTTLALGYLYLGMFEQAMGRTGSARDVYARGLSIGTFDIRIAIRLSWILATSHSPSFRDGRRAVILAETVNEIEGYDQPASLDALAAAYAEYGEFERAVATSIRAHDLANRQGDTSFASMIEQRRSMYEQAVAYRE
jgi:Flp pilus assembly protein TadD